MRARQCEALAALVVGLADRRIERGQELMRALRGRLSGLAQPTYVLDVPGGHGKVPIGPSAVRRNAADGCWLVEDSAGRRHCYPQPAAAPLEE